MASGTTLERLQVLIELRTKPFTDAVSRVTGKTSEMGRRVDKVTGDIRNRMNKINTGSAQKQVEQLTSKLARQEEAVAKAEQAVNKLKDKLSGLAGTEMGQLEAKLSRQTQAVEKQEQAVEKLQAKYNSTTGGGLHDKGVAKLSSELAKTEKEFVKVSQEMDTLLGKLDAMEQVLAGGGSAHGLEAVQDAVGALNPRYDELESKAERLRAELEQMRLNPDATEDARQLSAELETARNRLAELRAEQAATAGRVATVDTDPGAATGAADTTAQLDIAQQRLDRLQTEAGNTREALDQVVNHRGGGGGTQKKLDGIGSRLAGIGRKIGGLTGNMRGSKKEANGFASSIDKLGKRITRLVAAAFVFNILRRGLTQLRRYLWGAMKANDEFRQSLSQVGTNLKVAFAPIYEAVMPALVSLMNVLARVTGYIATLLNMLFGKTYSQGLATAKALDKVADSADKAGGSVKDAAKAANSLGIDEINVLNEENSGGGGGGGAQAEEMSGLEAVCEKVRGLLDDFFTPLKRAWESEGANVIAAAQAAFQNLVDLGKAIGASFMEVWTNGSGEQFATNILKLTALSLNTIADVALAFRNAWEDEGRGTALIQSYFDLWNAVLELILAVGESYREVWNSGTGESVIGHVLEILTNVNNMLTNIAKNFKAAWELDGTGTQILQDIGNMIDSLLDSVSRITERMVAWTSTLDFGPLLKGVQGVTEALKPLTDKVGAGLEWLFENVLQPLGKWAVESFIPSALDAISSALGVLDAAIDALKPLATWLWENLLKPFVTWTAGSIIEELKGIAAAFDFVSDALKMISEGKSWEEIGTFLALGIYNGVEAARSWLWGKIQDVFGGIVDFVKKLFGIHSPSTVFAEIGGFLIQGLIQGAQNLVSGALAVFSGLWSDITGIFSGVKEWFSEKFTSAREGVTNAFQNVGSWFGERYAEVQTAFSSVGDWFGEKFTAARSSVDTAFQNVGSWFGERYADVKSAMQEAPNYFSEKFTGARTNVTTAFQSVGTWFGSRWTDIRNAMDDSPKWFNTTYTNARNNVNAAFQKVGTWFGERYSDIRSELQDSPNWFNNTFSDARTNVNTAFETVGNWFGERYTEIQTALQSTPTWFQEIFQTAYTNIQNVFSPFVDFFKETFRNGVNGVIAILNHFISWVNEHLKFEFDGLEILGEEVIPSFSFQLFTLPRIPSVPQLAGGGIVGSGQLFIANEAGPELVGQYGSRTGVINNKQIVEAVSAGVGEAVYSAITAAQSGQKGDSGPIVVNLIADGRTLAKVVADANQRGGIPLLPT